MFVQFTSSIYGVLMGRCGTYHWHVLITYHWNVVGCFIWDLFETLWRRTNGTSLLRPLETSSRRSNKASWRRVTETSWPRSIETLLGVSFETYLRRHWDVQRDIATTSPRLLVAGWGSRITCHSANQKVPASNSTNAHSGALEPNLVTRLPWPSGSTRNYIVINIERVRPPPCQWPKGAAKLPLKIFTKIRNIQNFPISK